MNKKLQKNSDSWQSSNDRMNIKSVRSLTNAKHIKQFSEYLNFKTDKKFSDSEVKEILSSLIQYSQVLLEIAQDQGLCFTNEKSGIYDNIE